MKKLTISEKQQLIKQYQEEIDNEINLTVKDFNQNFYFHTYHDDNEVQFNFYIPQIDDNNLNKKSFAEIEIAFNFSFIEEDFQEVLEFDGQTIKFKEYDTENINIFYMMNFDNLDKNNFGDEESKYFQYKTAYARASIEDNTLIDFIQQVNKDIILPYLRKLSFDVDGKKFICPTDYLDEIIKEHNDKLGAFIGSIFSGQRVSNDISTDELKDILKLHNHYRAIGSSQKLETELPNKKDEKRLKL